MIKAPFNFVPLSSQVFFPDWADQISHDIPFSDGEDGVITLEIITKSPLFVRNGHKKGETDLYSSHILDERNNRLYFIPGSTLKGCFRNVMEIMSFSKMQQFNNDSFGFRSFTTQTKGLPKYSDLMKKVKCGWMSLNDNKCFIRECKEGVQKIRHTDILLKFLRFNQGADGETAQIKQESLGSEFYPKMTVNADEISYKENKVLKNVPKGTYRLVCTGHMEGKKTEYLFSENTLEKKAVSPEIFKQFETVHKFTPYYGGQNGKNGFLKDRLRQGNEIPVFFVETDGNISAIGITRMFRFPFSHSVEDAVFNSYDSETADKIKTGSLDLSECIFGYTEANRSLKGRVSIGNAFTKSLIHDNDLITVSGVLAQPRASYYPLYLSQNGFEVSNYSTANVKIAGRKRYRVTSDFKLIPVGQGDENRNILTHFKPIPKDIVFECKIAVHNLRKVEIGALLSSITMNGTEGCYHNIGQAKAFGYGIIDCKVKSIKGLEHSKEEYINAFDNCISFFLQDKCNSNIAKNEALRQLVNISSPVHTLESMAQMDFNECEKFKEDRNASILQEGNKSIHLTIDEKEVKTAFAKEEICKKINLAESSTDFDKSLKVLNEASLIAIKYGIDKSNIDDLISSITLKKKEKEEIDEQERIRKEKERINAEAEEKRIKNLEAQNAANSVRLSEKIANVTKLPTLFGNVKTWLKFNTFTDSDMEAFKGKIYVIYSSLKPKEQKTFQDFAKWKEVVSLVGEDIAKQWHSELPK